MDEADERSTPTVGDLREWMWRRGDLVWKLDRLQEKIHDAIEASEAKTVCVLSSRQIGKSFLSVVLALEHCIRNPGAIVRIIAPTLKQCGDIVNDNLTPICLDAPPGFISRQKSEYRWQIGSSSLRLGALERANVDGNRGGNATLVIYEECGFVSPDDFKYGVDSVLGPQLLRSSGAELYISSPSEIPDHPLHTQILSKCSLLGTAFRFTVYDSPSITPGMIEEAIRRCGGAETAAFKREYMAEIIRDAALVVVPDFHVMQHVKSCELPQHANVQVAIDWGGVRDLTVGLLIAYDFVQDLDLVLDERVFPANSSTETIVSGLREMEGRYLQSVPLRNADVSGQTQVDLIQLHDYQVRLPLKDNWVAAVNQMAVRFTQKRIALDPKCKFTIASLEAGTFNRNRTDFERSATLGHCDALAALMYGIRSQDRTNPWPRLNASRDSNFYMPKKEEDLTVAEAVQPKSFANSFDSSYYKPKKFGTFGSRRN